MDVELMRENAQVLNLIQAMIGLVTPNFRLVTVEICDDGRVVLRFLLEREQPQDLEHIDDIVFEFEGLQSRGIDVDVDVTVNDSPFPQLLGRCVYGRWESGY